MRRLPIVLVRSLLPLAERDELSADLEAEFDARRARGSRLAAQVWLWGQVFRSVPSLVTRSWWRGSTGFEPRANAMRPGGPLMERLLLELRFALRRLRTRPTYSLLAILTLSLGVGGMAAISGIARALLLDPLPYHDPDALVDFWQGGSWRAPEWLALRGKFEGFAGVAAYRTEDATFERDGAPTRLVSGLASSTELFDVLGVKPALGRAFADGEDAVNAAPLVVISHRLWRELGGNTAIIGSSIKLDGTARTIIGVMPRGFWFPAPNTDAWMNEQINPRANYGIYMLVGRLAPGRRIESMQPALKSITQLLAGQFTYNSARFDRTRNAALTSLRERDVADMRPALLATLAGMSIILLISCANVIALVLAQVESRSSELAVRTALGADRGRLATQLLLEVLVLGGIAGVVGAAFASGGFHLMRGALPLGAFADRATLDWQLYALAIGVGLGSALVVAFLPIVALWRSDLRGTLATARTGGMLGRRGGLQGLMVVSEVALAVLLACGAGLIARSVAKLYTLRPGLETRGIAVLDVATPSGLPRPRLTTLGNVVRELAALPGVKHAAISQRIPLRGDGWSASVNIPNKPKDAASPYFRIVSQDYFKALGIPLRRGRTFDGTEQVTDSTEAIVVNEALVKIYFPDVEPIGQLVPSVFSSKMERIIGVVGNVAEANLTDAPVPARYLLNEQTLFTPDVQTIVLRMERAEDAEGILSAARQTISRVAPSLAVQEATTMSRVLDRAVGPARQVMTLLTLLTGLALVLGAIGIYGVISQFVARRKRDWGIRVALGLAPARVVRLVVGHGTSLVVAGIVIGVIAAKLLSHLLSTLLYGVTPTDPIALAGATVALLAVGVLAALIPALRASRTDPALVLREQ